MKKLIAIVLSLSMTLGFSTTSYANVNSLAYIDAPIVSIQRDTGVEMIELPSNLSKTEMASLKKNISEFGNVKMTEKQVREINLEAAAKGGLVYGQWFGGYSEYYEMSLDESLTFLGALVTIAAPFLAAAGVTAVTGKQVATGFTSYLSVRYALPGDVKAGAWVKADMRKRYREVKYTDGRFAYFETGFFANNLKVDGKNYGTAETIFSGGLY